jgi:hypothetical protein
MQNFSSPHCSVRVLPRCAPQSLLDFHSHYRAAHSFQNQNHLASDTLSFRKRCALHAPRSPQVTHPPHSRRW